MPLVCQRIAGILWAREGAWRAALHLDCYRLRDPSSPSSFRIPSMYSRSRCPTDARSWACGLRSRAMTLHRLTIAGCLLAIAACGDSVTEPVTDLGPDSVPDPVADSVPEDSRFPNLKTIAVVDSLGPIFRSLDVELEFDGGVQVHYWAEGSPGFEVTHSDVATHHSVLLPRLRAETTYQYEIRAIGAFGVMSPARGGQFQTAALPPDLADFQFEVSGSGTFPLLMLSARAGRTSHTVMVDNEGYIVWYRPDNAGLSGFSRLSNGDFVFNTRGKLEVMRSGNEVVAALDGLEGASRAGREEFPIHHDVITTPSNTVLFLVQGGSVTVADTTWVGDEIWEWDPASDELTKRWAASDFLSPVTDRGDRSVLDDWLHANSLSIGPRGNILVSFFFLHEVLSINPDYESIEWRLGGPASSFVVADGGMEAGQHTAAEVTSNRVLLFDNGRDRPSEETFSRALEIELDTDAGTAQIVWEFRPQPDIYAPFVSSAFRLENGNTLVGFGVGEGRTATLTGSLSAFEVTPGGSILWQAEVVAGPDLVYRYSPVSDIAGEVPR